MNENLDRIKHGWSPRKDANWIWWIIADGIVLGCDRKDVDQTDMAQPKGL